MWYRGTVERFLANAEVASEETRAIMARMEEVVDADGNLPGACIDYVLGEKSLVVAFERAWEDGELWETLPGYQPSYWAHISPRLSTLVIPSLKYLEEYGKGE